MEQVVFMYLKCVYTHMYVKVIKEIEVMNLREGNRGAGLGKVWKDERGKREMM